MNDRSIKCFALALLLTLPVNLLAQFTFTTNNGTIALTRYTGLGSSVVIPESTNGYTVTSIGSSAFLNCAGVTNVIIPNSVTNIGVQAFTGCGLTSVVIPDGVVSIEQSAFLNCYDMASLTIGSNVVNIGDYAFGSCSSLTNVFIPKSVTNINCTAFNVCSSLKAMTTDEENPAYSSMDGILFDKDQSKLVRCPCGLAGTYAIPTNVTLIGDYAFSFCRYLTNVVISSGVTNLGQKALAYCSGLTTFSIPTNVIKVEADAFSGCANLASIMIADGVTSIGEGAFAGTGFPIARIPGSVTNIGAGVFGYCLRLTSIIVDTNNPAYSSIAGVLFNADRTTLVEHPPGTPGGLFRLGSYIVPYGVTSIGDQAFVGDYFLTNITIPNTVTSIGKDAFHACDRLVNLIIPDGVTNIGNGAFVLTSLISITIPASVTTFGWLGSCPSLRSIYFKGNAPPRPSGIPPAVLSSQNTVVYYLPGTTGWGTYFQSTRFLTALWQPQAQTGDGHCGVQTNQFGFNYNWASGRTVVVEACTNLSNPDWLPQQTNTLTTDSAYYADLQWTNYPKRFYRIRTP